MDEVKTPLAYGLKWGEGECIYDLRIMYKGVDFALTADFWVETMENGWPFAASRKHAESMEIPYVVDGQYLFKKETWEKVKDNPDDMGH